MPTIKKTAAALAISLAVSASASSALAWIPNQVGTTIDQIVTFQNGEVRVLLHSKADNQWCFVDSEAANGKALISAITAAYLAGKPVNLTCFDATASVGGIAAHQLHRFWMQ